MTSDFAFNKCVWWRPPHLFTHPHACIFSLFCFHAAVFFIIWTHTSAKAVVKSVKSYHVDHLACLNEVCTHVGLLSHADMRVANTQKLQIILTSHITFFINSKLKSEPNCLWNVTTIYKCQINHQTFCRAVMFFDLWNSMAEYWIDQLGHVDPVLGR